MARRNNSQKNIATETAPVDQSCRHCAQKTLAKENRRRSDFTVH
jgi:hypothetical protein